MKQITELLQERKARGYELAKTSTRTQKDGVWHVPSASNPRKAYEIVFTLEGATCNCENYKERGIRCKHASPSPIP